MNQNKLQANLVLFPTMHTSFLLATGLSLGSVEVFPLARRNRQKRVIPDVFDNGQPRQGLMSINISFFG